MPGLIGSIDLKKKIPTLEVGDAKHLQTRAGFFGKVILRTGVVVVSAVWLSACDLLLDKALDCLDNDRPDLRPNTLRNPVLNQTYDELVRVSVRNEPRDDRYYYQFFFSGNLPDGMQYESHEREFRLSGTAIELGEFRFSIRVEVSGTPGTFNDTKGLCSTVDTNNYKWTVQIM